MIPGFATAEGTARYAAAHCARNPRLTSHRWFQTAGDLTLSNIGLGSYLGHTTDAADAQYTAAVLEAFSLGINHFDTAHNYRGGRSETAIGRALTTSIPRDEYIVATKAGFTHHGHSLAPDFLEARLAESRQRLGLETIDIFYLHNPETQLGQVSREDFAAQLRLAFARCEELADRGWIRTYGTATWNGYREPGQMDLDEIIALAGPRFRWIQLPLNAVMTEALPIAEAAAARGLRVATSATIYQGRLAGHLPVAIQYARFATGVTTALIGMGRPEHVRENVAAALAEIE